MNDIYFFPDRRDIIEKIDNDNIVELRNYIEDNNIFLNALNEEEFDILIRAIDGNASTDIINYIIFQCDYTDMNYFIIEDNYIKYPLLSALKLNNFKIADQLLAINADINYFNGNIISDLRNIYCLNTENLKYILNNGYDIKAISHSLLYDLINNYDNDLLKIILNANVINKKIEIEDSMYEMTLANENYEALSILLEKDISEDDEIIERILKYNILEIAILINDYPFVEKVLNYGIFNNKYDNYEDIIFNSINNNFYITKLLIQSFIFSSNDSNEIHPIQIQMENSFDPKYFNLILNMFIKAGNVKMVDYLIENEIYKPNLNLNIKDVNDEFPLFVVLYSNDIEILDYLLKHGADCHIEDDNGKTLLSLAIEMKRIKFIKCLLDNNIDIDVNLVLSEAISENNKEIVELLINNDHNYDININDQNSNNDCLLIQAINNNSYDIVVLLINYGLKQNNNIDFIFMDKKGNTPLTLSYKKGYLKIFTYLLMKLNINQKDMDGYTILNYAIDKEDIELIKYLIHVNADVNSQDNENNNSIIYHAICKGNFNILKILLEAKDIDRYVTNFQEEYPLNLVIKLNNYSVEEKEYIINKFIEYGININSVDDDGNTALFYAIQNGYPSITELLIEHGANVDIKNKEKNSPIIYAVRRGYLSIVKLLIKNNTNINIKNKYGYSPFDFSVVSKNYQITAFLIESGFDVNNINEDSNLKIIFESLRQIIQDNNLEILNLLMVKKFNVNMIDPSNGWSLLHYAIFYKNVDIVKLLLENGANKHIKSYDGKTPHDINRDNNRYRDNKKYMEIYQNIENLLQ